MRIDYNGMKLKVWFNKGATLCGNCEENMNYEDLSNGFTVDTPEGEASLVLHQGLCEHIYATVEFDDDGGQGDFLVTEDGEELTHCDIPYGGDEE